MSIWIILLKVTVIALCFVMLVGTLFTMVERKLSSTIHNRVGPNRANIGPFRLWGLLHIAADGIKTLFKEDIVPSGADKKLHFLAPFLGLFPAMVMFAVVPMGDTWCSDAMVYGAANIEYGLEACRLATDHDVAGTEHLLFQIADIDAGLLFLFAVTSLGVYGAALAGWSSNNKYSQLGGLRASAQMISYEVTMLLALAGVIMIYGTIDLNDIVREQGELMFGFLPKWGIFVQPLGFVLFLTAAIAETKRAPFDLPEADSEIVAGYFTEYSSMKFAVFSLGEFIAVLVVGGLLATLFLGGWQVPFLYGDGFHFGDAHVEIPYFLVTLMRMTAFVAKLLLMSWLQFMLRWTLPRFRYDQLMTLGWKVLLPLSLVNILITGLVLLFV